MGDLPSHVLPGLFSGAIGPHTHIGLFSRATYPQMFILVYFQGRPAHTFTRSIFTGDLLSHSHWSIFRGEQKNQETEKNKTEKTESKKNPIKPIFFSKNFRFGSVPVSKTLNRQNPNRTKPVRFKGYYK
jgi:hypothetical protein